MNSVKNCVYFRLNWTCMTVLFLATNEGELSVNEGDELVVLEQDYDNSGWTKVLKDDDEGYVPSAYIELIM